jgi:hypothetical protein
VCILNLSVGGLGGCGWRSTFNFELRMPVVCPLMKIATVAVFCFALGWDGEWRDRDRDQFLGRVLCFHLRLLCLSSSIFCPRRGF